MELQISALVEKNSSEIFVYFWVKSLMSIDCFIPLLGPQFEQFWPLQGDSTLKQLVISTLFLVEWCCSWVRMCWFSCFYLDDQCTLWRLINELMLFNFWFSFEVFYSLRQNMHSSKPQLINGKNSVFLPFMRAVAIIWCVQNAGCSHYGKYWISLLYYGAEYQTIIR